MSEDTRRMLQPAAIGGVVFGVLSGIPVISLLNCACCAYAIGGGMLAAHLYFKDLPAVAQQSYGEGAMLGLLTGGIGATVTTVIGIPMRLFIDAAAGLGSMDRLNEILGDADLPAGIADLVGSLAGGGISIDFILLGFFMRPISYGLFAMVGGIIGVAVFQKKMAAELT